MTIRIATVVALLWIVPLSGADQVYNASKTGKTPGFAVDPAWPQPLPNHWILGQVGGLFVDRHDHVWVYNRPRTLTTEEAGLETAVPGEKDEKGQPINGLDKCVPMGRSRIAAKQLPPCWSSMRQASCCGPGAVRRTRVSSAENARRRRAAFGRIANTVFMSTRMTTSGSPAIQRRRRRGACGFPGQRTQRAVAMGSF
jgi:hypothetical protein